MRQDASTRLRPLAVALGLCLALAPAAHAADAAAAAATDPTPYVVGGGLENLQLSPDGTRVAGMVRTASGLRALVSRKLDGSDQRIAYHLQEPGMDLSLVRWLGNERFLLRVSNNQELVNNALPLPITRLVVIGINGDKPQVLNKPSRLGWANHMSQEVNPACPGSTLVQLPSVTEDEATMTLGRFDAQASRWLTPTNLPADSRRLFADAQGEVRLIHRRTGPNGVLMERMVLQEGSGLGRWRVWKPQALDAPQVQRARELGLSADGRSVDLLINLVSETSEVWRLALAQENAEPQVLLKFPARLDEFEVLRNDASCEAVALRADGEIWAWGDGLDRLVGGIKAQLPARSVELLAWQGDRYLARIGSPSAPTEYLVGTRSTQQLQGLGSTHVRLPVDLDLRSREIRLPNVNGSISALSSAQGQGPRPTLLCMDCQLDKDDRQGRFDGLRAYWAQQGWSVVDVDGESSSLRNAFRRTPEALRHWRTVIEGLITQGEALRGQIVVVALANEAGRQALLLGAEPDGLVQAVVTLGALTDVPAYLRAMGSVDVSSSNAAAARAMGEGLSAEEIRQRSPVHRAADLRATVLLMHADHDATMDPQHAQALHQALQARQHPSKLLILKNSTEQVDHPPYRVEVMKAIDEVLAGVRAAPVADQKATR